MYICKNLLAMAWYTMHTQTRDPNLCHFWEDKEFFSSKVVLGVKYFGYDFKGGEETFEGDFADMCN